MDTIKKCKIHGDTKHALRSEGRYRCRKCSVDAVNKRRRTIKSKAVAYKGGECSICGYKKCIAALEFHHTDGKDFGISGRGYSKSWGSIKMELDKCVLLCANCHREAHSEDESDS